MTTAASKPVWLVKWKDHEGHYAAWNFTELLTMFNAEGIAGIVSVELTNIRVHYTY